MKCPTSLEVGHLHWGTPPLIRIREIPRNETVAYVVPKVMQKIPVTETTFATPPAARKPLRAGRFFAPTWDFLPFFDRQRNLRGQMKGPRGLLELFTPPLRQQPLVETCWSHPSVPEGRLQPLLHCLVLVLWRVWVAAIRVFRQGFHR